MRGGMAGFGGGTFCAERIRRRGQARELGQPDTPPLPANVGSVELYLVCRPLQGASDRLWSRGAAEGLWWWWWVTAEGWWGREVRFPELGFDVLKRFYCDAVVFLRSA